VAQCPVKPGESFVYRFTITDNPGARSVSPGHVHSHGVFSTPCQTTIGVHGPEQVSSHDQSWPSSKVSSTSWVSKHEANDC
jgi:FtsP/CotA-like multicopper oxidase with cupredoxin domain